MTANIRLLNLYMSPPQTNTTLPEDDEVVITAQE